MKVTKSAKVKVYYTLRGQSSTRLASFQIKVQEGPASLVRIPLKKCLWAICSSSPDLVCHEHDLSVYTANFDDSTGKPYAAAAEHRDQFIWEGHGLMSWIMEDKPAENETNMEHDDGILVDGRSSDHHVDLYMELQPTIKWCKTEFYQALRSRDFDGLKQRSGSPPFTTSTCNCSIYAAMMNHQPSTSSSSASLAPPMAGNAYASSSSPSSSQQQLQQQQLQEEAEYQHYMKRKRLTPPPTPLTATTPASPPALPPISSSRSSTSPITPRLPPPNAMVHRQTKTPVTGSPPLFRPEPLLPESLHRASSSSTHAPRESSPQANSQYDRDAFHYRPSSSASYSAHPYPPHNHPPHHQHHHPHHHQQHHPRSVSPPPQHQHQHVVQYAHHSHHASSQQQPHHLPHAYPSSSSQKHRSAFTPTHVHHHHDQPHMASPPYAPQTHQLHHTARHHVYNYGPDVSLAAAHHHTSQVAAHGAVHAIQDAQPIHLSKKRKKYPSMLTTDNHKADGNSTTTTSSSSSTANTPPVRTFYEVDKDDHGNYILPVEIDSWTVVDLGTVVFDRPAYHNQRYIYPVNYTVRKWYRSMVDAKSDTQYTCRILDNGREPKFEVTADDCPVTYSGPTPTTVWTIIVRRAFAIRNQEYGHNPVGPDFFGLRKNTIAKMIQDLPHVEKCTQYVYQNFEPARFNKPGRNRRRLDTMISGSILGGVNYSLTSGRLNTHASHQQHQLQIQQRRRISSGGVAGTLTPGATNTSTNTSTSTASTSNNNAMNASATASHQGDVANATSSNNSSQPLHDDNVSVASSSSAVTTPPPHEKEPTPPHHLRHAHPHHNHQNHHVTPQKHENVASAAAAATYYAHPPAATTSPARTASPTPIETA